MFYVFIFESIGTSELMLIGLVALIVFGPRKLPELARTIGKTMADFRRSTDDFKRTWEKEVSFEEEKKNTNLISDFQNDNIIQNENFADRISAPEENKIEDFNLPQIKELNKAEFDRNFGQNKIDKTEPSPSENKKQDWL